MSKTREQIEAEIHMLQHIADALDRGLNEHRTPPDRLEHLVVIWRAEDPETSNIVASVPLADAAAVMRSTARQVYRGGGLQFNPETVQTSENPITKPD